MALMDESDSHDRETTDRQPRFGGARVLVVDDDGAMRELVSHRLTKDGFSVHEAVSGRDLLGLLGRITADRWPLDDVDLILIDNRMPGMSGLQAIRALRAAHWDTPAILMTAFPDETVKKEAQTLGVPVLPKPFPLDLLTNAIVVVLLSERMTPESTGAAS